MTLWAVCGQMSLRGADVLWLALACTGPGPERGNEPPDSGANWAELAETDAATLSTPAAPPPVDTACIQEVIAPPQGITNDAVPTVPVQAGATFDFDANGLLVTHVDTHVERITRDGARQFVAEVGRDVGVLRVLPGGDLVLTRPGAGTLVRWSAVEGRLTTVAGGMSTPLAMDVALDGRVVVAEYGPGGRVLTIDPYSGAADPVAVVPFATALAYGASDTDLFISGAPTPVASSRVYRLAGGPMGWDPNGLRQVHRASAQVDALASDVCGNVYVVETGPGRVYALLAPDFDEVEQLADFNAPRANSTTASRFGNGIGDFLSTELFVANEQNTWVLVAGIDGRSAVAP